MDVNSIGNIYVIPEHDPKSGRVLRDGDSMTVPGVVVSDIPDERQRSACMILSMTRVESHQIPTTVTVVVRT
jgi:hypothetical protein